MSKCKKCLYFKTKQMCNECSSLSNVLDNYPAFTPNTNYDRIRNMSVEELAEFIGAIARQCYYDDCNGCPIYKVRGVCGDFNESIQQYLESEVQGE